MSIHHAILGMLSNTPLSGYDLKKIMQGSSFMHWSGNNNQIYKVLFELRDAGYVTSETRHQDSSPSKKVYTITDAGLAELKRWVQSAPEISETKKPFLIQLAWTAQLDNSEIEAVIAEYEQEIKGLLSIEKAKKQKGHFAPNRTPREAAIWDMIYENIISSYLNELTWIDRVRQVINQFDAKDYENGKNNMDVTSIERRREEKMTHQIIEKNNQIYVFLDPSGRPIQTEQDGLELVSVCAENNTNLLLIHGERLSDDFLRLRTGIAGAVLQKFTAYNIKAAVVLEEDKIKGKFKEFVSESNRSNTFRVYSDFQEAENWLISKFA